MSLPARRPASPKSQFRGAERRVQRHFLGAGACGLLCLLTTSIKRTPLLCSHAQHTLRWRVEERLAIPMAGQTDRRPAVARRERGIG